MTAVTGIGLHLAVGYFVSRKMRSLFPAFAVFITAICFSQTQPIADAEFGKLLAKAENGSLVAEIQVAKAYESGRTGNIDYEQAARWFRKAADQGDPDSQNTLGVLYLSGRGVVRNDFEAVRWLQRACASGLPLAQHNLGTIYLGGWQIPADPQRGIELLTRAANAGLEVSQLELGAAYLRGSLVEANPELGFKWTKRAAHHHLPAADFILGTAYENGKGTKPDIDKAVEHYGSAADAGYAAAQNNLGRLYLEGRGVEKNPRRAMELFTQSAQQGNPESYFNLAFCSLKGCNGVVDATAAYGWYLAGTVTMAPPQSFQKKFADIASQLTSEEVKAAKSASQTWVATHPAIDPRSPLQLDHAPGPALALNRPTGTARIDNEVLNTLWQQTPFIQPQSINRASGR